MKLSSFVLHRIKIPLKTAFKHATYERRFTDTIIVCLVSADGNRGYGEILPRAYVTGENVEDVLAVTGPDLAKKFIGRSFADKEEVLNFLNQEIAGAGRNLATFCGFELALLDLAGKSFGFSIGEVIGGVNHGEIPAGVVIGFEVETRDLARYCAILRLTGKRHIKVKVGHPQDRERLTIIHDTLKLPIRLDANCVWRSADEALGALSNWSHIQIASLEQPLAVADLKGARRIRDASGIAVMADEAVCSLADAERILEHEAADIFNIRLGKCGGLLGALNLVRYARAHGMGCHLGTLVAETGILTRASEMFSRFVSGFECLDGKGQNASLLSGDVLAQPRDAVQAPCGNNGLGVEVSNDLLSAYAAAQ